MKEPEERNDVEERATDPDSMFLVPLDASTPMPLEKGLAMVEVEAKNWHLFHNYGITPNHHWLENIARARQADIAYKAQESARKRALIAAWTPIVTRVSSAVVALAGVAALILRWIT